MSEREAGSASVELVLLTPVLLVLLLFVVSLGRVADARAQVNAAARDAARAGTIARGSESARSDAIAAATGRLGQGRVTCRSLDVKVDTATFRPGGAVTATVTCTVDLADLTSLKVPGSRTVVASATEPVDFYRGVAER